MMRGIFAALLVSAVRATTTVVTYPDPKAPFIDNKFLVQVQAADAPSGAPWQLAPTYTSYAPPDGPPAQIGKSTSFVQVSTNGAINIRCLRISEPWDDAAVVRPSALGISTAVRPDLHTLVLTVPAPNRPGAYSISVENVNLTDSLLVFINPLETNIPKSDGGADAVRVLAPGNHTATGAHALLADRDGNASTPQTIVFSAGLHFISAQTRLPDNTRVYIAGGAYVFGSFTTAHVAKNVTVDGRGIISGSLIPGGDSSGLIRDQLTLVNMCGAGMTISGIAAVDAPSYLCVKKRRDKCGVFIQAWRGVAWRGVAWRGVAWRGVAWRGVAWRGVGWRGVGWRGVAWRGAAGRGAAWRGGVWHTLVVVIAIALFCDAGTHARAATTESI
jgi:hypothetical protein